MSPADRAEMPADSAEMPADRAEMKDRVAVVTGGASGMGRALATRFGLAGCRVVVADIEEPALAESTTALEALGIDAVGFPTDVSDAASMDELAAATLDAFGQVDLVFNNAGVGGGGTIDTLTTADWEWVLGVNLWGVIHGLRVFLPHLLAQDSGYVVNTASIAGHTSYARMGPYNASKHAVVSISETLYAELHQAGSGVGVSVLCPGIVNTNILASDRNRPEHLKDPLISLDPEEAEMFRSVAAEVYSDSLDPEVVGEQVLEAVLERRFYVWTDDIFQSAIARRHADIAQGRNPTNMGSVISPDQPIS
jgi:NAD(P)-dependent dehydrogenase (short-subunit alcohol dehydrogenase family)